MEYIITAICSLLGSVLGILAGQKNLKERLRAIEKKVDQITDISVQQGVQKEQIKNIKERLVEIERKLYGGNKK